MPRVEISYTGELEGAEPASNEIECPGQAASAARVFQPKAGKYGIFESKHSKERISYGMGYHSF